MAIENNERDGGQQAFPQPVTVGPNDDMYPAYPGMTLRDWFAGQALVGFAAGLVTNADNGGLAHPRASARVSFTDLAKDAFTVADAMIAERSN